MELSRRQIFRLTAVAAALSAMSLQVGAQTYPTRPVRIIVGFPPGGSADIVARLMGQWLAERLGQQFIIESRPGAGTNMGTEAIVRATPDGYSLLLVTQTNAINATLYDRLNFNFVRDIAPAASIVRVAGVMEVNPSFPARTVPEFVAYAKSKPAKINMASGGNGSGQHLYGELFKMMAGVDLVHVPYRGSFFPDLLGGQVQVTFSPIPSSIEFIRAGKLHALAVTSATRSDALPDIPAMAEFVPGYEASGWFGLGAPKNTPAEIIDKLNKEVNAALADPTIRKRLADLGGVPMSMTPTEFGKLFADETEKWGNVVKFAGIRLD